jgi:hypothetical protein
MKRREFSDKLKESGKRGLTGTLVSKIGREKQWL